MAVEMSREISLQSEHNKVDKNKIITGWVISLFRQVETPCKYKNSSTNFRSESSTTSLWEKSLAFGAPVPTCSLPTANISWWRWLNHGRHIE